jgi:SMODS-associated NUDIX domain
MLLNVVLGVLSAAIFTGLAWYWRNRKSIRLWMWAIFHRGVTVRVSVSALLSCTEPGGVWLYQNRTRPSVGPLGGVRKIYRGAEAATTALGLQTETVDGAAGTDVGSDLRGTLPAHRLIEFMRLLKNTAVIEPAADTLRRELVEELYADAKLTQALASIPLSWVRRGIEGPRMIETRGYWQIRIVDVFEIGEGSDSPHRVAAMEAIRGSALKVTPDEIRAGELSTSRHRITSPSLFMLGNRARKESDAPL